MQKFLEEAEIHFKLRSPFIVLFMGICIDLNEYMLITELIDYCLFDVLHIYKNKIRFKDKLNIIKSIANGMNCLHQ